MRGCMEGAPSTVVKTNQATFWLRYMAVFTSLHEHTVRAIRSKAVWCAAFEGQA